MTYRFTEAANDYATVTRAAKSSSRKAYDAAMRLPQGEERGEAVRMADGIVRAGFAAKSWVAGVEDAAANLRELITVHDNGGTASSPKKIKAAARELLTLLAED